MSTINKDDATPGYTEMSDNAKTKSNSGGLVKIIVLLVIACSIGYVIYDQISKGCVLTEKEVDRTFRISCGNGNATTFTCDTAAGTDGWTTNDAEQLCQKDSSCVNVSITSFLSWIQDNTLLGAVAFALLYVAACILFIPGSVLTIGAGVAFGAAFNVGTGVLVGTLCVWIGSNTGAALAFLLGRYLFRDWVSEQVKKVQTLAAIDKAIDAQGFKTVLLLRLSPVIPFNLFNYLMGATGVSFSAYVSGSLLGMLPGTAAYVFIGAALGAASSSNDLESCNPDRTLQNIVLVVGVVATFFAVGLISYYAKQELNQFLDEDEGGDFATTGEKKKADERA